MIDGIKKNEAKDRRTYFSLLDGFFPKCTLRVRGLSNNHTSDEDQLGCRNPLSHEHKQGQLELGGDIDLRGQDDQDLQRIKIRTSSDK